MSTFGGRGNGPQARNNTINNNGGKFFGPGSGSQNFGQGSGSYHVSGGMENINEPSIVNKNFQGIQETRGNTKITHSFNENKDNYQSNNGPGDGNQHNFTFNNTENDHHSKKKGSKETR